MVKFILGPVLGYGAKLNLVTTVLTTVAGMMTIVLLFTFFTDFMRNKVLKRFFGERKRSDQTQKRYRQLWDKYGIVGVAILTPLILTPIGGTLLAVSFGAPRNKLIFYMFISASVWAFVFSSAIYFFGNEVLPDFLT
jgi:membrane protein DedA with SNARE-associated domain